MSITTMQIFMEINKLFKAIKQHLKGQMINRILHLWSFPIKFINLTKGLFNKFHMKWSQV